MNDKIEKLLLNYKFLLEEYIKDFSPIGLNEKSMLYKKQHQKRKKMEEEIKEIKEVLNNDS